jgi:hypothetical protein
VGVLAGDQELGGLRVGLERVGGDPDPGEVEVGQQWGEGGDLFGGAGDLALGQHRAGGVVHAGQQVRRAAVGACPAGAALEDTGGLLCRAEDRQHCGNLAFVAEGHAEHPRRRVGGQHGQLVEAAAALTRRHDRQRHVSSRFTMPVSSCRADAMVRLPG